MNPNAIEVRGLRKTYPGGIEAVRGIDFDVAAGELFGLFGPNGVRPISEQGPAEAL